MLLNVRRDLRRRFDRQGIARLALINLQHQNPDHFSLTVQQRPTDLTWFDRKVRPQMGRREKTRQILHIKARHKTKGRLRFEIVRESHADHGRSGSQPHAFSQGQIRSLRRRNLQNRDTTPWISTQNLGRKCPPIDFDRDRLCLTHHRIGGQNGSLAINKKSRPSQLLRPIHRTQTHHRRRSLLIHSADFGRDLVKDTATRGHRCIGHRWGKGRGASRRCLESRKFYDRLWMAGQIVSPPADQPSER